MHAIFPIVMFGAIALFVMLGVVSMFTRNNLYDQIGQGGLTLGEDRSAGHGFSEFDGAHGGVVKFGRIVRAFDASEAARDGMGFRRV